MYRYFTLSIYCIKKKYEGIQCVQYSYNIIHCVFYGTRIIFISHNIYLYISLYGY